MDRETEKSDFEWHVSKGGYENAGEEIVRLPGKIQRYSPDEIEPPLHYLFVNLRSRVLRRGETMPLRKGRRKEIEFWELKFPDMDHALFGFISTFGFLRGNQSESWAVIRAEHAKFEEVWKHRPIPVDDSGDVIRGDLNKLAERLNEHVPMLQPRFEVKDDELVRVVRHHNLVTWMWDRLCDDLADVIVWTTCQNCSKPMGTAKRRYYQFGSKFCSATCRANFNKTGQPRRSLRIVKAESWELAEGEKDEGMYLPTVQ